MNRLERPAPVRLALLLLLLVWCGCTCCPRPQEPISPWKFAVLADTQGSRRAESQKPYLNERVLTMIAHDLVQERPDFVLVAGDLVNGWLHHGGADYPTQFAAWKEVMKPVYEAGIRVYPVRGNHEDGPERFALPPLPADLEPPPDTPALLREAFRQAFDQPYIPQTGPPGEAGLTYSFSHKNALVIGIDVFSVHQHQVNQAWFDARIASRTEAHLFVFGHEPAFGVSHTDNLSLYPRERDQFWNALGKGDGRVYFCGHDHVYNRAAVADEAGNTIRQIVAGTGGGTLKTWSGRYAEAMRVEGEYHKSGLHGYVIVTVAGAEATIQWKAMIDGQPGSRWEVLDSFSYTLSEKTSRQRRNRQGSAAGDAGSSAALPASSATVR